MTAAVVLASEVVGNAQANTLVTGSFQTTNAAANGTAFRVTVGGLSLPTPYGSVNPATSTVLTVCAGANGTNADPVVAQAVLTPQVNALPSNANPQAFFFDALVTLRANAKSAGAAANGIWTGLVTDPIGIVTAAAANGNVNSAWSASNTANISVSVQTLGSNSSNTLVETCVITQIV